MEKGKLNVFYIDSKLKWGTVLPSAYFTNATEKEFFELLDNFLSEIESKGVSDFSAGVFTKYVAKNGYYILTEKSKVLPPYIP
jgi:hypothetical protein